MTFSYRDTTYRHVIRVPDQVTAHQQLKPDVLVLVMPGSKPKSLKLLCPCGCGTEVSINFMHELGELGKSSISAKKGLSIWPSIWLDTGCCSHFILRRSRARLLLGDMPKMSPVEFERWWDTL